MAGVPVYCQLCGHLAELEGDEAHMCVCGGTSYGFERPAVLRWSAYDRKLLRAFKIAAIDGPSEWAGRVTR